MSTTNLQTAEVLTVAEFQAWIKRLMQIQENDGMRKMPKHLQEMLNTHTIVGLHVPVQSVPVDKPELYPSRRSRRSQFVQDIAPSPKQKATTATGLDRIELVAAQLEIERLKGEMTTMAEELQTRQDLLKAVEPVINSVEKWSLKVDQRNNEFGSASRLMAESADLHAEFKKYEKGGV